MFVARRCTTQLSRRARVLPRLKATGVGGRRCASGDNAATRKFGEWNVDPWHVFWSEAFGATMWLWMMLYGPGWIFDHEHDDDVVDDDDDDDDEDEDHGHEDAHALEEAPALEEAHAL
ncbi:hypothetical protein M885DRAFT_565984 [Pelagophyceae sp. CCMP2097]|nr:hypothetical protein M885DRAFT_565984 [Pelagophyceae sp. CCMP2097]